MTVLLALVTVITRAFVYTELRAQPAHGVNGTNQIEPAAIALVDRPLHRIAAFTHGNNNTINTGFDGVNDSPDGSAPHHDFTLLDLGKPHYRSFFSTM